MSFLSDCSCTLLFTGGPCSPTLVCVGVPQHSPISPLLFLIYVAPLHHSSPCGIWLSYVDDFSITVVSESYQKNACLLSLEYNAVAAAGNTREVSFSVSKTEAIYWHSKRNHSPPDLTLVRIGGSLFLPLKELCWIGFWLSADLSSAVYYNK